MMKALSFVFVAVLMGCSSGPLGTNVSEPEINAEALQAYTEIKSKSKVSNNAEWTAMVRTPSRRAVRMMRRAISPRFATSRLGITRRSR